MNKLTEAEEIVRGMILAEVLQLRLIKSGSDAGRYHTEWGTKTPLGLFRICERIILDGE